MLLGSFIWKCIFLYVIWLAEYQFALSFKEFIFIFQFFYLKALPLKLSSQLCIYSFQILYFFSFFLFIHVIRHLSLRTSLYSWTGTILVHVLLQTLVYSGWIFFSFVLILCSSQVRPFSEIRQTLHRIFILRKGHWCDVKLLTLAGKTFFFCTQRLIFIVFYCPILVGVFLVVSFFIKLLPCLLWWQFLILNWKVFWIWFFWKGKGFRHFLILILVSINQRGQLFLGVRNFGPLLESFIASRKWISEVRGAVSV